MDEWFDYLLRLRWWVLSLPVLVVVCIAYWTGHVPWLGGLIIVAAWGGAVAIITEED